MDSGRAPQHPTPRARVDKSRRPAVRCWFGSGWIAALPLRRRRVSRRSSLGRPFGTPGIAVDGYAPASRARHNRQTTAFETHNGRSISTAGTALNAPKETRAATHQGQSERVPKEYLDEDRKSGG